jgi:hypothetical protein
MQSCSDSDGGSAPSGQLDTSTSGVHTYTVAAISRDGLSAMASISYTVLGAPSASIAVPASGARYTRGQVVKARYSCQGAKNGPGISSCTGTIANGYQIDTTHPGRHQFAVTATSKDGARTTTKVCYMVVAPSNRLTVSHIHSHPDGTSEFDVKIPGPGRLEVFESPWMLHAARVGTVRLSPAPDGFGFSLAHLRTKNAGTIRFEVVPAGGGQRRAPQYFGPHRTITLWVTYRPDHGTARTVGVFRVPIPVGVNRPPRDEPENGVSVEVIR